MFCTKCGNEIKDTDKFCIICGNSIEEKFTEKNLDEKKGKKGLLLGGVIGAIIILASIIIGVLVNANNKDEKQNVAVDENALSYTVYVDLYSALEVEQTETGTITGAILQGATVSVRGGSNVYEGDVLKVLDVDSAGRLSTNLPSGTYTAQVQMAGYADSYLEIKVNEQETTVKGFLLPLPAQGETGVVMTWSGADVDLDLTLFTPYQSSGGDMARIGGNVGNDAHGNRLVADNNAQCEVMYVNTAQMGNYKLFVNNYTDSLAGNYSSTALAASNVYVYMYDSNGFVTVYTFPLNQSGVVWEVVEINGTNLNPIQKVYEQLEGEQWWAENKEARKLTKEINYRLIDGEWSVSSSTEYVYDNAGKVIQECCNYGGTVENIFYTYDNLGRIETKTDANYIYYYIYDDQDKLTHIDRYLSDTMELNGRDEYIYDNLGRVSSCEHYFVDPNGNFTQAGSGYDSYCYDDYGNLSIELLDGMSNIYHFYDSKGNLLRSIEGCYDGYDTITGYTEYIYENATGSSVNTDNWKLAYLDIILEEVAKSSNSTLTNYDFIYLDNDEIPELVIDCACVLSVYSYKGGTVYTYIDDWMYGAGGVYAPEYSMNNGMVRMCISDDFGATQYNTYFKINDVNSLEEVYSVTYRYYSDLNGSGYYNDDEPWLDNPIIEYDGRQITEAEYNGLPYSDYSFDFMEAKKTAYDAVEVLHGM